MRSRFTLLLSGWMVLCILGSLDAHVPLLKLAAWGGMLVSRSAQMSLTDALETTFDGEHPCEFCKAIKAAQESSQGKLSKASPSIPEIKLLPPFRNPTLYPPPASSMIDSPACAAAQRNEPPLLQPPRCG